jgi:hypothetical protein
MHWIDSELSVSECAILNGSRGMGHIAGSHFSGYPPLLGRRADLGQKKDMPVPHGFEPALKLLLALNARFTALHPKLTEKSR